MNQTGLLLAGVLLGSAMAASQALTITPARTEVLLAPGQSMKSRFEVLNETHRPVRVELTQKDWFVLPQNGGIASEQWLKLKGKKSFRLNPGERRQVPMKIRCPEGAQGDLVAMASFAYQGDEPSPIQPMISVSVYLTVAGTEKREGEIRQLLIAKKGDAWRLGAVVGSTGNVHLRPSGRIQLRDAQGRALLDASIKSGEPVYPGEERKFSTDLVTQSLAPGRYTASAEFESKDWKAALQRDVMVRPDGELEMDKPL